MLFCSTGECQNYAAVLTPAQLARWNKAQTSKEPVEIVTLEEAKAAEKQKSDNERKHGFSKQIMFVTLHGASSRKFIWDALATKIEGKKIMCMSGYGKEAYGLYRKFSSKAVEHTIKHIRNSLFLILILLHKVSKHQTAWNIR